jgi:adenine-specific DNA-methyltransferase
LKVARNLLAESGVILMSIGDEEVSSATQLMNEIFGEENAAATFVIIRSEGGGLAKQVVKGHDYLLVFAKQLSEFMPLRRPKEIRGQLLTVDEVEYWLEEDWLRRTFGQYGTCEYHEIEQYLGKEKRDEVEAGLAEGIYQLVHKRDGRVVVGRLRKVEDDASKFYSVQKHLNARAADDLERIGMPAVFDFPKPVSLIADVVLGATFFSKNQKPIVMDFFAGSGTSGQAVMEQNLADGGNRQFVLVQLPEVLDPSAKSQVGGFNLCEDLGVRPNLAELTKERLRRAGAATASAAGSGVVDTGFRVFALDSSNIEEWAPDGEDFDQVLTDAIEHLRDDRTDQDILFEVLLKLGLPLTVPIENRRVGGEVLYSVGFGTLFACFAVSLGRAAVEAIGLEIVAWCQELEPAGESTVVFRDSAFKDDVAKTNLTAILEQHGLSNVRSL